MKIRIDLTKDEVEKTIRWIVSEYGEMDKSKVSKDEYIHTYKIIDNYAQIVYDNFEWADWYVDGMELKTWDPVAGKELQICINDLYSN